MFEQCSEIKSQDLIKNIEAAKLSDGLNKLEAPSTLVQASEKFIKSFSEQLIVQYCALSETISNKQ